MKKLLLLIAILVSFISVSTAGKGSAGNSDSGVSRAEVTEVHEYALGGHEGHELDFFDSGSLCSSASGSISAPRTSGNGFAQRRNNVQEQRQSSKEIYCRLDKVICTVNPGNFVIGASNFLVTFAVQDPVSVFSLMKLLI